MGDYIIRSKRTIYTILIGVITMVLLFILTLNIWILVNTKGDSDFQFFYNIISSGTIFITVTLIIIIVVLVYFAINPKEIMRIKENGFENIILKKMGVRFVHWDVVDRYEITSHMGERIIKVYVSDKSNMRAPIPTGFYADRYNRVFNTNGSKALIIKVFTADSSPEEIVKIMEDYRQRYMSNQYNRSENYFL